MAKITSGLLKTGKIAKKGNSLVRRTNAFIGRKIGRKGRTIAKQFGNLNKTTARGKNNLLGVPKQLELPLNADTAIKKPSIARIARNEVKSFISNAADRIEQNVESFDPNKFLGKVFEGGLQRLSDFGSMVEKMANSGQMQFLGTALGLATDFVDKLASGKGGGGWGTAQRRWNRPRQHQATQQPAQLTTMCQGGKVLRLGRVTRNTTNSRSKMKNNIRFLILIHFLYIVPINKVI